MVAWETGYIFHGLIVAEKIQCAASVLHAPRVMDSPSVYLHIRVIYMYIHNVSFLSCS